ncbi:hypothetical protein A4A49_38430 [Nicotiana attenuata]|uniref:Uncharacterized protein n=1 Tax=Nicotiana attenuata TaxID=49451 RepID=A0A1J6KR90_NICAT|nr:hypothetical protein A4A49_38430 [Nicotiana attenuata]
MAMQYADVVFFCATVLDENLISKLMIELSQSRFYVTLLTHPLLLRPCSLVSLQVSLCFSAHSSGLHFRLSYYVSQFLADFVALHYVEFSLHLSFI